MRKKWTESIEDNINGHIQESLDYAIDHCIYNIDDLRKKNKDIAYTITTALAYFQPDFDFEISLNAKKINKIMALIKFPQISETPVDINDLNKALVEAIKEQITEEEIQDQQWLANCDEAHIRLCEEWGKLRKEQQESKVYRLSDERNINTKH